jgi:hypothetical protein
VPAGALSAPTAITITEDSSGPPPPYVPLSPLYRFAPDGLTFTKPASIAFSTTSSSPVGNVYWSLASGPGYEALPTTWVGTTASALITHFSSGFVGTLPNDGAVDASGGDAAAAQDATVSDGGTPEGATTADAPEPQDGASDGRAPADGGAILDAGSTYVWGILRTAPPGPTTTVAVDELSSEPDADGGCTAQALTGHQEVTIPTSALPYYFRFYFADAPTSGCTARAYNVSAEYDVDGGLMVYSTSSCMAAFGASVECDDFTPVFVPIDASSPVQEAGSPASDAGSDGGAEAGSLLDETIQFSGTATGTVAPGASFLYISLRVATDPLGSMNGMPFCTPTVNTAFNVNGGYTFAVPTLPTTYSFSFGPLAPQSCGAAFEIVAYPVDANLNPLSGGIGSTTYCGWIGGGGGGGPELQSTSVTCNISIP